MLLYVSGKGVSGIRHVATASAVADCGCWAVLGVGGASTWIVYEFAVVIGAKVTGLV